MFVFSMKADRRRLLLALVCVLVLVVAVVLAVVLPGRERPTGGRTVSLRAATAEERVSLLRELGHEVDPASERVEEVRLPDDPDDTLRAYETVQEQAGMGLLPYCGKRVKRYTYRVTNAQVDSAVTASLYVYRDRVVAGDITAAGADGFQKPLAAAA